MKLVNIREYRKACDMTQAELAAAIGVQRAVISKYESGSIVPSVSKIEKIADALGVDPFSIMDFDLATDVIEKHIDEIDETSAFDSFLGNIGYKTEINLAYLDSGRPKGMSEWIIKDCNSGKSYLVSTNKLNELMNSILAYSKFQVAELLSKLDEVPSDGGNKQGADN